MNAKIQPPNSLAYQIGKAFFLLFFCASPFCLFPQQFQVDFNPGRQSYASDMFQEPGGDYLISSFIVTNGPFGPGDPNLTRVDLNRPGNRVVWSNDYTFPLPVHSLNAVDWSQENAFLIPTFLDTTALARGLVKVDQNGNVLWGRRFGGSGDVNVANLGNSDAVTLDDNTVVLVGGASVVANTNGANDLWAGKIDPNGNLLWGYTYCFSCLTNHEAVLRDVQRTSDGNILIVGQITPPATSGPPNEDILLMKIDTSGAVLWTKGYDNPIGLFGGDEFGYEATELGNGNIALAGVSESFSPSFKDGMVLITNANGNFIRSFQINLVNGSHDVDFRRIYTKNDTNLIIAASTVENINPSQALEYNFLLQVTQNGVLNWSYSYFDEIAAGYITTANAFTNNQNGGFIYLPNDAQNFSTLYPVFVSANSDGIAGCQTHITMRSTLNNAIVTTNYSPTVLPTNASAPMNVGVSPFNGYSLNLPTLELRADTTICGTFNLVLDADIGIPARYQWSTGDTTQTITVTAAGTYFVAVEDTSNCLTLRDTVVISGGPNGVMTNLNLTICAGDSVFLEGAFQTTAGTYVDSLLTSIGCDSIVNTALTVNPAYNLSQSLTLCHNDSVFLGGAFQSTSGTYTDTFTSVSGCDSIMVTQLTVLSAASASIDTFLCSGESLTIAGNTLTQSGQYTFTLSTANGCDSTISVDLTVEESAEPIQEVGFDCATGQRIFVSGTEGQHLWSDGTTSDTLRTNSPGTLSLLLIRPSGCVVYDTVEVSIPAPPVVILTPNFAEILSGEPLPLQAITNVSTPGIQWIPPDDLSCTNCLDPIASP